MSLLIFRTAISEPDADFCWEPQGTWIVDAETELWKQWLVLLKMRGWSKISFIYMNRLQNFSLRIFFGTLLNGDVSCRCKVESRWVGLMLVLSQLSSAATLCLSCCPSSPAAEVSVVYSLLSFGFLPCSSSVYLYFQVSPACTPHTTVAPTVNRWLMLFMQLWKKGEDLRDPVGKARWEWDRVAYDTIGCKGKHLGAVQAVSF